MRRSFGESLDRDLLSPGLERLAQRGGHAAGGDEHRDHGSLVDGGQHFGDHFCLRLQQPLGIDDEHPDTLTEEGAALEGRDQALHRKADS